MKNKGITALILSLSFSVAFIPGTKAATNVSMSIDENVVTRSVDREMYGINCEWSAGGLESAWGFLDHDEEGNIIINPDFSIVWKDLMVFARQAGSSSQAIKWKDAIGPFETRKNQLMWGYQNDKVHVGIIEWLKALYSATPDAKICYTVNMDSDTIENMADIVEFLVGDGTVNYNGGENWAEVRKSLGIEKPVDIYTWELGNELDWMGDDSWTKEEYVEYCKQIIPVIKAIDPDGKITCLIDTTAHANGDGWEAWHREILSELGDEIDYLAFHYYYPAGYVRRADIVLDRIEQDILEITGSDRIKIYISEQAPAPNSYSYDKNKPYDYCLPHTIWGATALAEFYLRLFMRPSVVATTDHSIDSSVWCIVYHDDDHKLHRSPTGDTIGTFITHGVGDVLSSELETYSKDQSSNIAGAAVRDSDGNINILFTNRNDTEPVTVNFSFAQNNYKVAKVTRIHGDVRSADNWYRSGSGWEYNNPDRVEFTEENVEGTEALLSYTFDPLSIYALRLEATDTEVTEAQEAAAVAKGFVALGDNKDFAYVYGKKVDVKDEYSGAKAYNDNGTFMIPSEMLSKIFGAELVWDDSGNVCTAKIGGRTLVFDAVLGTVTENGKQLENVAPAKRVGEWTYFRLRSIAELLSLDLEWDNRGFAILKKAEADSTDDAVRNMIYNALIGG